MTKPATSYGKDKLSRAAAVAYRWCHKEGYNYSHTLCADILKDICTEKRRYRNRINNRKYPKGSLRPGHPKKEETKHALKSRPGEQMAPAEIQTPGPGDKQPSVPMTQPSTGSLSSGSGSKLSSAKH